MPGAKIGVFDSGVGGQSVINAIKKELPNLEIIYKDDKSHLPYGSKTVEEIHSYVRPIFQDFVDEGWLKEKFAQGVKVIEPDCSDWALMIENNQIDREKIAKTVVEVCDAGADQIVLGCTHYHWIEDEIKEIADGKASIIQPEQPVINQLKRVLGQLS
jgi:glutamate racemase